MPEIVEVSEISMSLNMELAGKELLRIELTPKLKFYNDLDGELFETDENNTCLDQVANDTMSDWNILKEIKINKIVDSVTAIGKHIIFILIPKEKNIITFKSYDWVTYFENHLGMSGFWSFDKAKNTFLRLIYLENSKEKTIYYNDYRRFGHFNIFNYEQLHQKMAKLGPDILRDVITNEQWLKIFQNRRSKDILIFNFLLNQEKIAGLGNYLVNEILYMSRINPFRTMETLTIEELMEIKRCMHIIVKNSELAHGLTIEIYNNLYGEKGNYKCLVYKRKTDDNNYNIVKVTEKDGYKNNRTVHWVPEIQK